MQAGMPNTSRVLRILRDQIWQFVSCLVAAVAIFTTYHVFFLQQDVKALQVVLLASTSLIEVERSVAEEIRILYGDQTITNLSLFQIKVENIGRQPICEEDYARSIKLIFPPQAEVIEAVVLESNPPNIGMTVQKEHNAAILPPVLLNEKDRAIIRMLVSNVPDNGSAQPFNIDARIVGVKEVHLVSAIEEKGISESGSITPAWWLGVLLSAIGGFVAAGVIGFLLQKRRLARKKMGIINSRSR